MAVEDSGAGLSSSLTDLMASLAVIFILLLVASLNNAQQESETTRNDIRDELQEKLQEFRDVIVDKDANDPLSLWVIVPQNLLGFSSGKDEIPLPGVQFLEDFVPRLAETACSLVESSQGVTGDRSSVSNRPEAGRPRLLSDRKGPTRDI